jgi:hypothetical protein
MLIHLQDIIESRADEWDIQHIVRLHKQSLTSAVRKLSNQARESARRLVSPAFYFNYSTDL